MLRSANKPSFFILLMLVTFLCVGGSDRSYAFGYSHEQANSDNFATFNEHDMQDHRGQGNPSEPRSITYRPGGSTMDDELNMTASAASSQTGYVHMRGTENRLHQRSSNIYTGSAYHPKVPVWTLRKGKTIGRELKRWARIAHWNIVWNLSNDWSVASTSKFDGPFQKAAKNVIQTLADNGVVVRATIYKGNRTIVVNGPSIPSDQ